MTQDQTARLAHIRKRYDVPAPLYRVIECVFLLPPGIRSQSVAKLELRPGDRVLELGVGTGRNLPHLVRAVGPTGSVLGVDLSPGMLSRARRTCSRRGWSNVELREGDAAAVRLEPASLDGVLFSLSYGAIPDADAALRNAWRALKPGGRVVVLDARLSADIWGRMARPFVVAASRATVLGDPDRRAWDDLRAYTDQIEVSERLFGGYFICQARKPG